MYKGICVNVAAINSIQLRNLRGYTTKQNYLKNASSTGEFMNLNCPDHAATRQAGNRHSKSCTYRLFNSNSHLEVCFPLNP